jgi:hypothetical protein
MVGNPTIQVSKIAVPMQFVPKHLWRHCQMENMIPAISSALAIIVAMPPLQGWKAAKAASDQMPCSITRLKARDCTRIFGYHSA